MRKMFMLVVLALAACSDDAPNPPPPSFACTRTSADSAAAELVATIGAPVNLDYERTGGIDGDYPDRHQTWTYLGTDAYNHVYGVTASAKEVLDPPAPLFCQWSGGWSLIS